LQNPSAILKAVDVHQSTNVVQAPMVSFMQTDLSAFYCAGDGFLYAGYGLL